MLRRFTAARNRCRCGISDTAYSRRFPVAWFVLLSSIVHHLTNKNEERLAALLYMYMNDESLLAFFCS